MQKFEQKNHGIDFSRYMNRLVKVVFREDPLLPIEVRKGILTGFDNDFIQLESNKNIHVIARRFIVSIKVFNTTNSSVRGEQL